MGLRLCLDRECLIAAMGQDANAVLHGVRGVDDGPALCDQVSRDCIDDVAIYEPVCSLGTHVLGTNWRSGALAGSPLASATPRWTRQHPPAGAVRTLRRLGGYSSQTKQLLLAAAEDEPVST
jgi:hypothetical protein